VQRLDAALLSGFASRYPTRHSERSGPIFFFRFRSCESVGPRSEDRFLSERLWRGESLFLFESGRVPHSSGLRVRILMFHAANF
jgi:hypothetical protein